MFNDADHPNIALSDWTNFREDFSPYRFAEVIDRSALNLPDWFVPLARGAAVPSDVVQRKVGCRPGSRRPAHWTHPSPDVFQANAGQQGLTVQKVCNFWMVGRWQVGMPAKVLVFAFGSTLIFTRTYQPAIRLAGPCFCEPQQFGYRWVTMRSLNSEGAVSFANERRADEANARGFQGSTHNALGTSTR